MNAPALKDLYDLKAIRKEIEIRASLEQKLAAGSAVLPVAQRLSVVA